MQIANYVLEDKKSKQKEKKDALVKKAKREELLELARKKQSEELEKKPLEEIMKELDALDDADKEEDFI